jgi:glycosyltransferase involved in cell wall biosynthesis
VRVFINPIYNSPDKADGGIRRVSEAMVKYLPAFGWDVTSTPDDADLIANHGAGLVERPGVPMVSINHGLMWSSYGFGTWGDDVNKHVIESMARANAVTAPSRWVAHAISRGMLIKPEVVYHGVDGDEWQHNLDSLGYVLWNKARADQVSDPRDMQDVAALLPDVPFLSTFGRQTNNVGLLGAMPYEQMRPIVQQAGVYLATARETFGIGTLEAMAAGVPVAGWRYGGQEEIIIDGETGYLAEYGDYDGLAAAIRRCLAERDRLSQNAVADIQARWGWKDKIGQYAALFDRVYHDSKQQRPKVSVVVTCHNLGKYLPDALDSVIHQTMTDWECLIVDDWSTDTTPQIAEMYCTGMREPLPGANLGSATMRYLRTPHNLKLSGARNYGASHATGRYLLFLDADDMLTPNALDVLSHALDTRPDIHVAFGHLDTIGDDGANRQRNPWPGDSFDWHAQIAHLNQLHYSSMLRREVFERSGGYRMRDWRAEDASFWTRLSSFGVRIAKVTEESTLIYRLRPDSKSRGEDSDGDWTAWLPWRLAGDPREGMRAIREGRQPNPTVVPFGAQGQPPAPLRAWPVHHHQHPIITIIIPVGPGHEHTLIDALDSVQAQTMPFWECIVVNDTRHLDTSAHPWARVVPTLKRESGAGAARNRGLQAARSPLVLFLDADDVIVPRALELLLRGFVESGGSYAYSDWLTLEDETRIDGAMEVRTVEDYDPRKMLHGLRHAVTALVPTDWVRSVGGFDEKLKCFEDWDLFCKLSIVGACGVRVPQPLLIYRRETGMRTRAALRPRATGEESVPAYTPLGEQTAAALYDRYAAYVSGEETIMPCGSCGGQSAVVADAQQALSSMLGMATGGMLSVAPVAESGTVRMEFIGGQWGEQSYIGKVSGRVYRAGRDPVSRFHDVDVRDAEHLQALELFRIVPPELLAQAAQAEDVPAVVMQQAQAAPRGRKR